MSLFQCHYGRSLFTITLLLFPLFGTLVSSKTNKTTTALNMAKNPNSVDALIESLVMNLSNEILSNQADPLLGLADLVSAQQALQARLNSELLKFRHKLGQGVHMSKDAVFYHPNSSSNAVKAAMTANMERYHRAYHEVREGQKYVAQEAIKVRQMYGQVVRDVHRVERRAKVGKEKVDQAQAYLLKANKLVIDAEIMVKRAGRTMGVTVTRPMSPACEEPSDEESAPVVDDARSVKDEVEELERY